MNAETFQRQSINEVERAHGDSPADRRIVHCEADEQWYPELLRMVSEHNLNVLARSADIVVFFDAEGAEIGWRDEGRTGAAQPMWIDRDLFLEIVIAELELPPETVLVNLAPRELPPVGWTLEGLLVLSSMPTPGESLRVWLDPARHRVIQCLAGSAMEDDT